MKVSEYLKSRKITPEEMAASISERLGRTIAVGAILSRQDKEIPAKWAEVLEIPDDPPDIVEEAEKTGAKPKRAQAAPPKPTPEFNPMLAEERVAAIYSMIGRGVATATKEPQYTVAFNAHADKCGRAWAELAKHDKHVATVLTMLTAGGPWGEVIWLHMSLGFALVVISGKVEIGSLGGIIPGQAKPAPATDGNGAGGTGAPDTVGDATSAPD